MKSLHIAITADPYIPVPPILYGGIERVVDFVVRGLLARGHFVTLFAHPDSKSDGTLVSYGKPPHFGIRPRLTELWQLGSGLFFKRNDVDIVLSWGRLASMLPILPLRNLPKIQRYCRDIVPWKGVKTAAMLAGESICFAGASNNVYRERSKQGKFGGNWVTIYDGVEIELYDFAAEVPKDAPLVFLGRIEPVKGAHHAISIAKAAGKRLVIAGNMVSSGPSADYFQQHIAPYIDGDQIEYVGPVDDKQKNALLGKASALLMPIEWEEAFGIVMAEAMACGTPVIAFPRGSVPEVVRDGINGFICRTVAEAANAVGKLKIISRESVRRDCESRFESSIIIDSYEQLCFKMFDSCRKK